MFTNQPQLIKRYAPFIPGIPAPATFHDEAPYICLRLNEEWIPLILGALHVLVWEDLYSGSEAEKQHAAREAGNLLASVAQGNMDCAGDEMILRQNTINPCLLEYSVDGGSTWQPAFDYSLCSRNSKYVTVTNQDIETWNNYSDATMITYNGDITNVAPAWQYGDPDDVWRDMAMCWAAQKWVDICAQVAIEVGQMAAEEQVALLRDISTVLGTVGDSLADAAAMGVYPEATRVGALCFEIASWIVGIVPSFIHFDADALSDQTAREVVGCAIYDALAGAKPTFAAWSTALANHGLIGNEEEIADATYLLMQSEEAYVQYLLIMADIVPVAELAGDLGCPCDETWEILANLMEADLPDYLTITWGSHVPGVGVFVVPHQAQGYNQLSCNLGFTPLSTNWTLTNVYMEYAQVSWGELPNNYPGITFGGNRLTPPEGYTAKQWVRFEIAAPAGSRESGVNVTGVNDVYVQLRVSKFTPAGQGVVKTLRLRGLGVNPFLP